MSTPPPQQPDGTAPTTLDPRDLHATVPPEDPRCRSLLETGDITLLTRMPTSSNATFLVTITNEHDHAYGILKPEIGERPLTDFSAGLWRREIAAYELDQALGFNLIPPTVQRTLDDIGDASLQLFCPTNYADHYLSRQDDPQHRVAFQELAVFDILANNTDRKSGHCIFDTNDKLWAIDNGLCFHHQWKLRTVIWEFAEEPVPAPLLSRLEQLKSAPLPTIFATLLSPFERDALHTRLDGLLRRGSFPSDPTGYGYPWPLI